MTSPRQPRHLVMPAPRQPVSAAEPRMRAAVRAHVGADRARAAAAETAQLVFGTRLPANLTAPHQARAAIRRALAAWGMSTLTGDTELLASELVANAAEHAGGQHIDLILRAHATPGRPQGITCEVRDTSPALPRARPATSGSERGRGLSIVAAIASASGVTPEPGGKTAWFTLTIPDHPARHVTQADPEAEAGA